LVNPYKIYGTWKKLSMKEGKAIVKSFKKMMLQLPGTSNELLSMPGYIVDLLPEK